MAQKKLKQPTTLELVAEALGATIDRFDDGSGSWCTLENNDHVIELCFTGSGQTFEEVIVSKKVYDVVDIKMITRIEKP